jgi:hypothetical protein
MGDEHSLSSSLGNVVPDLLRAPADGAVRWNEKIEVFDVLRAGRMLEKAISAAGTLRVVATSSWIGQPARVALSANRGRLVPR